MNISRWWGVAPEDIDAIVTAADQSRFYSMMRIPKRGKKNHGKYRTVFKAEWGVLHQLQKNIARDIGDTVSFPECVQGFVSGRSAIENAKIHVNQRVILHADIENFFDTIEVDEVYKAFVSLGCNHAIATLLSRVCTLNGHLPQGASTSPIVSNLVCAGLDTDLTRYASVQKMRYSRYADDLTFSGEAPPDLAAIRRIVEQHKFKLREDKVRTQWRGKSQYVTGLSVGDASGPRVPLRMKRQLRLELYYATKYGIEDHQHRVGNGWHVLRLRAYWRGWIDYMNAVPAEGRVAERLGKLLDALEKGLCIMDQWREWVKVGPVNVSQL